MLVAGSGGPDSTALAAAAAFAAPRLGLSIGFATADQHWSERSAAVAEAAVGVAQNLGLHPAVVVDAPAARTEGAAREARRAALMDEAARQHAVAILLGHSLDDQAETVLLRLARGSGARSMSAMAAREGPWRRPFLGLRRALLREACATAGLATWDDPANADPAFARSRVRAELLPQLEAVLGPGIAESLARTAALLRSDADALDDLAASYWARFSGPGRSGDALQTAHLAALPEAVRTRVLRRAAVAAGCPPGALSMEQVLQIDALVTAWRGQGPLTLPGGVTARRGDGRLILTAPSVEQHLSEKSEADPAMTDLMAEPDRHPDRLADQQGSPPEVIFTQETGHPDIAEVLITREEIAAKIGELAAAIDADYAGQTVLLVGVLKGAAMVMADLSRALSVDTTLEFMAVSSYGSSTSSSGVVRILKDLDRSIEGIHVLIVEDIIDSGLTLSWLIRNLRSRHPASVEVVALLRKPEALKVSVDVRYVGFDIPSAFVVGYGLDYAERYRTLPFVGTLTPEAIERGR